MTPLFTANFPRAVVESGLPFEIGPQDWLISISDADGHPPSVKDNFGEVHHFFFDDETDHRWVGIMEQEQAIEMAAVIRTAQAQCKNVYVHCQAGICRSGAVVEVLGLLGWQIVNDFSPERIPNAHVFKLLRTQFEELQHSWELEDKFHKAWESKIGHYYYPGYEQFFLPTDNDWKEFDKWIKDQETVSKK